MRYVGGHYGGGSELEVQRELAAHGPLVVGLFAEPELLLYRGGLYHSLQVRGGRRRWAAGRGVRRGAGKRCRYNRCNRCNRGGGKRRHMWAGRARAVGGQGCASASVA